MYISVKELRGKNLHSTHKRCFQLFSWLWKGHHCQWDNAKRHAASGQVLNRTSTITSTTITPTLNSSPPEQDAAMPRLITVYYCRFAIPSCTPAHTGPSDHRFQSIASMAGVVVPDIHVFLLHHFKVDHTLHRPANIRLSGCILFKNPVHSQQGSIFFLNWFVWAISGGMTSSRESLPDGRCRYASRISQLWWLPITNVLVNDRKDESFQVRSPAEGAKAGDFSSAECIAPDRRMQSTMK